MCASKDDSFFGGPQGFRGKNQPAQHAQELIESLVTSIERLLCAGGFRFWPSMQSKGTWLSPADTLRERLSRLSYEDLVKLLKELLAIPMAVVMDSDLPPVSILKPSASFEYGLRDRFLFLFPAVWGRFVKLRLLRSGEESALWMAAGILGLKKGLPDLRGSLVQDSLAKHEAALTLSSNIVPVDASLLEMFAGVARSLFPPGSCPTSWDNLTMATSATTATPRSRGGARGELLTLGRRIAVLENEAADVLEGPFSGVVEVRGSPHYRDPLRVPLRSGPRGGKGACPPVDVVRPVVVADPLKSRVVTLTHVEMGLLKPFQQAIHGRLRRLPPFVLTGEWVTADHLNSRFRSGVSDGKIRLNSGDFSAATDNVESAYSRAILKVLMEACYPQTDKDRAPFSRYYQVGLDSLTENRIEYEDAIREQVRGQLMGSLLSFPVLCVFNFCVYVVSHYYTHYANRNCSWNKFLGLLKKKTFLQKLAVLINGDDLLSGVDEREYETWRGLVTRVGWSLSVGKSYLHSTVAVINSQVFRFANGGFQQIVIFNNGLLSPAGQSRSSAWLGEQPPVDTIGELATQFLRGSKDPLRSAGDFVRAHGNVLRKTKRPLFLVKRLGGLGGKFPSLRYFERWYQPAWISRYAAYCRKEKVVFSSSSRTVRGAERFTRQACENMLGVPLEKGETPDPVVERCLQQLRGTIGRRTVPFPSWRGSNDKELVARLRRLSILRGVRPLSSQSIQDTPERESYLNRTTGGVRFAKTRTGLQVFPLRDQEPIHRVGGLKGPQHVRFSDGGDPTEITIRRFGMTVTIADPREGSPHPDLTPAATPEGGRPSFGLGGTGKRIKFST